MARTPEDDLAVTRSTPLSVAREQVRRALALGGAVDDDVLAVLGRPDVASWIANGLERLWRLLIGPDWPQLLAIVERDVQHRADRLVRGGWTAALEDLHDRVRWQGGAVLISGLADEQVHLDGRGLMFVPTVFLHPGPATYTEPPGSPPSCTPHAAAPLCGNPNRPHRQPSHDCWARPVPSCSCGSTHRRRPPSYASSRATRSALSATTCASCARQAL
jgi:hypothetical protein